MIHRRAAINVAAAALALLCVASAATVRASEPLKNVVSTYLEIHAQLAADKMDGVPAAADRIAEQAAALPSGGPAIAGAAKDLGRANDVKTARDRFSALSDAVIAAAKAEGWKDLSDVKLGYCPMLKRSWLQKDKDVRNPYGMLTCGVIKDR
jgi:hypothetical protein